MRLCNWANVAARVLAAALCAGPLLADQLTLGGANPTVYFCSSNGANSPIVLSTVSGCSPTGGTLSSASSGSFESPQGATLLALQPWSLGLPTGGFTLSGLSFVPVGAPSTGAFSWGSGSTLITGTITWTQLKDSSSSPDLIGNLVVATNTNTGPAGSVGQKLASGFQVGHTYGIDYAIGGVDPHIDVVYKTGKAGQGQTSGTPSSGEVLGVPEVSSIVLFAPGMLLAGLFVKLRRRKLSRSGA